MYWTNKLTYNLKSLILRPRERLREKLRIAMKNSFTQFYTSGKIFWSHEMYNHELLAFLQITKICTSISIKSVSNIITLTCASHLVMHFLRIVFSKNAHSIHFRTQCYHVRRAGRTSQNKMNRKECCWEHIPEWDEELVIDI